MKGADFMGNNSENKPDRYINIGIVAHVDAWKDDIVRKHALSCRSN